MEKIAAIFRRIADFARRRSPSRAAVSRALHKAAPYALSYLFFFGLFPLVTLYLSEVVTRQSFGAAAEWMLHHGGAVWWSWVLLFSLSFSLYVLTRHVIVPTAAVNLAAALLTLVSHFKTAINGYPLMLSDFTLAGEGLSILDFVISRLHFTVYTCCAIVLFLLLIALSVILDSCVPYAPRPLFALLAVTLTVSVAHCGVGFFADRAAAMSSECQTQAERNDSCGLIYGLYCAYASSRSDTAEYTDDTVNRLDTILRHAETRVTETVRKPTIIFLLSESFFDPNALDNVVFADDPIPNFHRLSEACTNGSFVSSTFAGGTGNVELEVLTGLSNSFVNEADALTALPGAEIYSQLPSVPALLKAQGYDTYYIHTYNSVLYDRLHTMPALGFDTLVFDDALTAEWDYSGFYLSDATLTREIIARMEAHEGDAPLFIQAVSMENHQPYYAAKYDELADISYSGSRLNDDCRSVLDALLTGLSHADAALGELIDYLETREEPVMLVFYGDHLPSLVLEGTDTLYKHLGTLTSMDTLNWSTADFLKMFSTDYLIWTNYETSPAPDRAESTQMLGVHALSRAGISLTPYFQYLDDTASASYLLWRPHLFVNGEGLAFDAPDEDAEEVLTDCRMIAYDLIYGGKALAPYCRIK